MDHLTWLQRLCFLAIGLGVLSLPALLMGGKPDTRTEEEKRDDNSAW